jgi:hypothetical protein
MSRAALGLAETAREEVCEPMVQYATRFGGTAVVVQQR